MMNQDLPVLWFVIITSKNIHRNNEPLSYYLRGQVSMISHIVTSGYRKTGIRLVRNVDIVGTT